MDQEPRSTRVTLENTHSGMTLHEDATDRAGKVLLAAGTTLTDRHLQLLNANGVASLTVKAGSPEAKTKKTIPSSGEIDSTLRNRFQDNDPEHPLIKELARICRARMEAK